MEREERRRGPSRRAWSWERERAKEGDQTTCGGGGIVSGDFFYLNPILSLVLVVCSCFDRLKERSYFLCPRPLHIVVKKRKRTKTPKQKSFLAFL